MKRDETKSWKQKLIDMEIGFTEELLKVLDEERCKVVYAIVNPDVPVDIPKVKEIYGPPRGG